MSLYKQIQDVFYTISPNLGLITSIELQLTLSQFKTLVEEIEEDAFISKMINWEKFDITEPITFLVPNGRKLIVNIK